MKGWRRWMGQWHGKKKRLMVQVIREGQRSNEAERTMLGRMLEMNRMDGPEGSTEETWHKTQLCVSALRLGTDSLVVSCCWTDCHHGPSPGETSGHSVWQSHCYLHTHPQPDVHTETMQMHAHGASELMPFEKTKTRREQESKSAAEWRAAGSEWERGVTESSYPGNQVSRDNWLISGWTVRYPGWSPKDVGSFPFPLYITATGSHQWPKSDTVLKLLL